MKKVLSIILLIFWLAVIFMFSNQPAKKSESLSDNTTVKIIEISSNVTKKEYNEKDIKNIVKKYRFLIRKTAHFTLYFILGLIVYFVLLSFGIRNRFLTSVLICLFYASSDEIHQMFVSQRTAKILDVFIDTFGAFIAVFLFDYFNLRKKVNNENN